MPEVARMEDSINTSLDKSPVWWISTVLGDVLVYKQDLSITG